MKTRLPCDATRAADHDDTSIACQISSQISKKMKTIPEEKEPKVLALQASARDPAGK
jgi:hypothetical protein